MVIGYHESCYLEVASDNYKSPATKEIHNTPEKSVLRLTLTIRNVAVCQRILTGA